jgi:hypothetical protein
MGEFDQSVLYIGLEISQIILANNKNLKIRIEGKYSQK